jgi:hypothetical protein
MEERIRPLVCSDMVIGSLVDPDGDGDGEGDGGGGGGGRGGEG